MNRLWKVVVTAIVFFALVTLSFASESKNTRSAQQAIVIMPVSNVSLRAIEKDRRAVVVAAEREIKGRRVEIQNPQTIDPTSLIGKNVFEIEASHKGARFVESMYGQPYKLVVGNYILFGQRGTCFVRATEDSTICTFEFVFEDRSAKVWDSVYTAVTSRMPDVEPVRLPDQFMQEFEWNGDEKNIALTRFPSAGTSTAIMYTETVCDFLPPSEDEVAAPSWDFYDTRDQEGMYVKL